jgi:hypothetical protein
LRAQDDPRAVIEKAIKALGGEARINKYKAGRVKSKGTVIIQGIPIDMTLEVTFHLPDKFKTTQEAVLKGQSHKVMMGYDGSKAWLDVDGTRKNENLDLLADLMKEQAYVGAVTRLTNLRDKAYELSSLGEAKFQDKPALGVRVASKGHKDVNLYFDKNTGLLARVVHRTLDIETGKEINEERIFLEYQDRDGLMEPKKAIVNRDGEKAAEVEVVELKDLNDIDDTLFSKP